MHWYPFLLRHCLYSALFILGTVYTRHCLYSGSQSLTPAAEACHSRSNLAYRSAGKHFCLYPPSFAPGIQIPSKYFLQHISFHSTTYSCIKVCGTYVILASFYIVTCISRWCAMLCLKIYCVLKIIHLNYIEESTFACNWLFLLLVVWIGILWTVLPRSLWVEYGMWL